MRKILGALFSLFVTMELCGRSMEEALCLLGAGADSFGVVAAWRLWAERRRRVGIVRGRQLIGSLPFAEGARVTFALPIAIRRK